MALSPGTRLGPYEITAQIGVGGMGEVYRATDANLKRAVAIKVLPESVAADAERLARFQREAEVLASLNHPHIAAIYGLERSDGITALVMELVEGEDLSQRIARGAMAIDEALQIARQMAEALEAAHEQGIIHRDLKPANIKVRPDGTVKVLDFGLAKAMEPIGAISASVSMSPTITSPAMTQAGMILGTAAYMSPEQAKGRTADKRSDVWAFGCVLYEMLAGRRAFQGEDVSDTLAFVITKEPDWSTLPANTPAPLRRLLRRSLEKDRKRRLPDIGIARIEIDEAVTSPASEQLLTAPSARGRKRIAWVLGATAVVIFAALAVPATLYLRSAALDPMVTRLDVVTPATSDAFSFALSPDGRQLAFVANGEKGSQLWLRRFDQPTARPLAETERAIFPFWAPDSRAIGFFADAKLKRLNVAGGPPQVLAEAPQPRGGTWNSDGVIVFVPSANSALVRVAATGGTPTTPVTRLEAGQSSHRWPQFLPDGRVLFLMTLGQPETRGVYVASLDGGEPTRVLAGETAALYAPPGYLLRVSQGVLVAERFDAAKATVAGEPIPMAQDVAENDGTNRSALSVSAAGVVAYRGGATARRQLVWVDRMGKVLGAVGSPDEAAPANPQLAPDGQRVAVNRNVQGNIDVWLIDLGRSVTSRLTFHNAPETRPVWSPDGSQVVFTSIRGGLGDLFAKSASGGPDEHPLLAGPQDKDALDWPPEGRVLLYSTQDPKMNNASDLWALPMTGERKPFPVVQTSFDDIEGQFSPDARWLAYASNESGRYEIYITPFPEVVGKWQISTAGGTQPRWGRDGRELFYVASDGRLMAVPLRVAPDARTLNVAAPVALFSTRLAAGANIAAAGVFARAQYAVAADGRFLMLVAEEGEVPSPITVALNWAAALKK